MFHVPYPVMATIHAKRAVADTNVRVAARALVAEMRLTAKVGEQLRTCEEKASILVRQKEDLIDESVGLRASNTKYKDKVKRKNRKLLCLLIPATYGVLKGAQPFVPQLKWVP